MEEEENQNKKIEKEVKKEAKKNPKWRTEKLEAFKKNQKTHFFAECRRVALGKGAITVTWPSRRLFFAECHRGTREILCRVSDMRHSTKMSLL